MKEITNVLKSKQFLIGLGVGFAGYWAYNKYMSKEGTSNASGRLSGKRNTLSSRTGKNCNCGGGKTVNWCKSSCENCCGLAEKYPTMFD